MSSDMHAYIYMLALSLYYHMCFILIIQISTKKKVKWYLIIISITILYQKMIYVKINSIDKEIYCISVYIYITTMGGGVSIDRCVDEFNAAIVNRETDENCKQKEKQLSNGREN